MYNQRFGVNRFASVWLMMLELTPSAVPRFRDAFLSPAKKVVIYTRTGGPNRPHYDNEKSRRRVNPEAPEGELAGPWNDDLRALPNFLHDEDDLYDSTYCRFVFEPIPELKQFVEWAALIEAIERADLSDPRFKNIVVGKI